MPDVMRRAYSVLHIKSVDDEQRVITGIASTPTPDRSGDIVEPLGVTFKNPLPLLLYHDSRRPVGTVRLSKPTKDGVGFSAILPKITEPGTLKDRVDEAWQSIKAGLLRGTSIGFVPLNDAVDFMKDTGGLRIRESEILELSLVAVPANVEARIETIKQFDTDRPASASGSRSGRSVNPPGVPGLVKTRAMKNISEQITAKRAELKTKSARLEELSALETIDETQTEERDQLVPEVKDLVESLDRLDTIEKAQMSQARPVGRIVTLDDASRSRSQDADPNIGNAKAVALPPGIEFARMVICKMAALRTGESPIQIAKSRYPDNPRIEALLKTAVVAGNTTATGGSEWGSQLVYATNLVSEFIEFLRPQTIIGRIPNLRRVPFNVRITGQSTGGSATWVGERAKKPLTKFDFTAVSLYWAKISAISVISDELARFSSPAAEGLVRDGLGAAVIERMDTDFIDPDKAAVANVSPASIVRGITPIVSAGSSAEDIRADIKSMVTQFITANINPTTAVFIMPNTIALALSLMRNPLGVKEFPDITMNGGTLEGFPVVTSQYAGSVGSPATGVVILVNATDIFLSDDGQMSIDISRETSLQMDDDPNAGVFTSMFQSNLIAIRAERYINWARRRDAAVAWLESPTWGEGSPA